MAHPGKKVLDELFYRFRNPADPRLIDRSATPAELRAINDYLASTGRGPLTKDELFNGRLDHEDNRTDEESWRDQNFSPVLTPAPKLTVTEQLLAEAQREADEEAYAAMPPAERNLARLKKAHLAELASQASAEAHAARLASPEVAGPVEKLKALLVRYEAEPSIGLREVNRVRQALAQFQTPNASLEEAARLLSEVKKAEAERLGAIRMAAAEKLAAANILASEADEALASLFPEKAKTKAPAQSSSVADAACDAWISASEQTGAAQKAYDAAKAGGAEAAKLNELYANWTAKLSESLRLRETYEALKPADQPA